QPHGCTIWQRRFAWVNSALAHARRAMPGKATTVADSLVPGGSAVAGALVVLGAREGVVVRGGSRLLLVRVLGLGAAELDVEPRVEGRGQRGQRPQRQVLPAAEDLADPPRGDAHPGREVGAGEAALTHMPVDIVRQLRDEGEHLLVDLGFCGPLLGRNA